MTKMMFCPKCGAAAQSAESYCKLCGDWLPDVDALTRPGLFRKRTREEKIRKMRVLEVVSAGLSLTAAAIIAAVLYGNTDVQLLFLAFLCCLFVALYQGVNFFLGRNLQHKINQSRVRETGTLPESRVGALNSGEATEFVNNVSVVENTTKRLDAIPRKANRLD
jgi:hypothetical protein